MELHQLFLIEGISDLNRMPIIVSHLIGKLKYGFFWMGGGHPQVKLRVSS